MLKLNGIMVAGGRIDLLMNYVEVPFLYQINVLFFVKSNGSFFYEINWLIFSERMVTRLVPFLFTKKNYKVKSPEDELQVRNKKQKKKLTAQIYSSHDVTRAQPLRIGSSGV
jgi:hypothetical protein